jgi:peptidoglycan/xylan/chitin deacetylase (PgdA/CDA1 family)
MKKLITGTIRAMSSAGIFAIYGFLRSRMGRPKLAIIAYHRVASMNRYPWSLSPVTPEVFEREIRFILKRYRIISCDELINQLDNLDNLSSNTAVITFDDGYKDVYLNAYPILKKYNLPAIIFLTTGHIGKGSLFWWDRIGYILAKTRSSTIDLEALGTYQLDSIGDRKRVANEVTEKLKQLKISDRDRAIIQMADITGVTIPSYLGEEMIMSWHEIKEMSQNNISFGSHSVTHPILTRIPLEEAEKEIVESKRQIAEEIDQEVTTFCYPNGGPGDYNVDIENILKRNGYRCAVTLAPAGFVMKKSSPFELPRITNTFTSYFFEFIMSGLYTDLAFFQSRR